MNHETYHWTQLQNNPFNQKISLEQFYGKKPQELTMKVLLKGESRGNGGTERIIIFDQSYVISYLINKVFSPLVATQLKLIFTILFKTFFEYCHSSNSKLGIKLYKLHGEYVIRLSDIGINLDDLKEVLNDDSI